MRGIHVYERRRLPRLSRLGWGALFALAILLGAATGWAENARADEVEAPRYQPSARGPRASYGTDAVERWRDAVEAYAWPAEQALLVVACESEGDPGAINPRSGATGLFQLYGWAWLAERLTGVRDVRVAWVNIRAAFALWADSGGTFAWHWAASRGCWGW